MKTNISKYYKFDKEKAFKTGAKYFFDETTFFVLAYYNPQNPKMKAALLKYYRPHARQIETGNLDENLARELNCKMLYDVCVLGWEGIEIDGKPLSVSQENFVTLMKALCEENEQAFNDLRAFASDIQNFKPEESTEDHKEEVGNS